jgi:hypothetical protein
MAFRRGLQLFHRGWFNACVAYIHHQVEALPQMVGALHNHVQGLEALRRDVALGRYLGLSAVEVEPDENLELVVQNASLSHTAATQPPQSTIGMGCDVANRTVTSANMDVKTGPGLA